MKNIGVIGAGTMGNGIAHVFALNGRNTVLIDISNDVLALAKETIQKNLDRQVKKELITADQAQHALSLLTFSTDMNDLAQSELVIEAATEQETLKKKILAQLDTLCLPETILASNTSSLSITKLASATQRPDRVIGMHFMNPVPVMKLVEIIRGYDTSDNTTDRIQQLSLELQKTPVIVEDYPGFVANKILMPMINEAIITLNEGISDVLGIDTVMKLGMAHPMGPLRLADFIGLDVCLSIMNILYQGYGNTKYAPCPLLVNMVEAGHLGAKSGTGFYDWTSGNKEIVVAARFRK